MQVCKISAKGCEGLWLRIPACSMWLKPGPIHCRDSSHHLPEHHDVKTRQTADLGRLDSQLCRLFPAPGRMERQVCCCCHIHRSTAGKRSQLNSKHHTNDTLRFSISLRYKQRLLSGNLPACGWLWPVWFVIFFMIRNAHQQNKVMNFFNGFLLRDPKFA